MTEQKESTVFTTIMSASSVEQVVMVVPHDHPLLRLKRALPWEAIEGVMVAAWRQAGKNLDGAPGRSWPVSLYVPLLVLMLVKRLNAREMEAYLAENAVARVFVLQQQLKAQLRDHASIARALDALGAAGIAQLNALIVQQAAELGFADPSLLSADTSCQELPIGYPHEAGIFKGIAQRCLRALSNLQKQGVGLATSAIEPVKEVLRSVKTYHLFAKSKAEKDEVLLQIMRQSEVMIEQSSRVVAQVGSCGGRVKRSACQKLTAMQQVTAKLIPQVEYWLRTGYVAAGKLLHPGITQAKAIVRNKAGKRVEFGLPYLINRLGGGYVFGKLLDRVPNETKMPLESLGSYRAIFGEAASPELFVYDRGGWSASSVKQLKKLGVKQVGIVPKGQAEWCVAEPLQHQVRSERSRTEGSIGTLKSETYGFNKPKERIWATLQAAGQRSFLSMNLNKLMRDLVAKEARAKLEQAQGTT